jgi:hypothetical protein
MNYKIGITEENRAIVKRIADENGMNPINLDFSMFGFYYPILNNLFYTPALIESDCTKLTTGQFIELFDKKEPEWKPKRGDRVLVWDDSEDLARDFIFLEYIKGSNYPYIVVSKSNEENFIKNIDFGTSVFKHMKPLPIEQPKETDFKSKFEAAIELIETKINDLKGYEKRQIERNEYYNNHSQVASKIKVYNDLINDIKQL